MKRFMTVISLFAGLLMTVLTASAQEPEQLPLKEGTRYGQLPNGLTYFILHNEEPKGRADFYIAQKVGSVQEDDNQRGLAHFLEHMCFNGSVNFPADGALIKYCESIGVKFGENLNAYTAADETVYNIDDVPVTPDNVDSCLLILHDWADGLLLEPAEIDKERGVIHEEWRMRSSASQRILQRQLTSLYPGSKYGERMPIGLMEIVDNFSPEFLRSYYEKWYRPDLQGVIIVGDVDVDEVEGKIKDIFSPIQMPENPAPYEFYPVPDNEHAIYAIDSDKEQKMPMVYMMFKDEPMPQAMNNTVYGYLQNYVSAMICSVLNERLAELSLKEDCPFVASEAEYAEYMISKTMNALNVIVVPKQGQEEAAVTAAMTEVIRAARFGVTPTELSRASEEFLSQIEKAYDNRDKQKNNAYVQQYVQYFLMNNAFPGIENDYEIYKMIAGQINADAINASLQQLVASTDRNFVLLGMFPEGACPTAEQMKSAVEAASNADIQAFVDNVKNEPLISKMPKKGKIVKESKADFGYTRLELGNGVNVYYRQTDFNNSEVMVKAVSKGGKSLLDVKDLVNANLTSDVINSSGVGSFSSTELNKALAGKQVTLSVGISNLSETMTGRATPKDLETLFQLIYLRFQKPSDDIDAYNNVINTYRTQLENAEKNPMSALQDSLTCTIYGHNPRTGSVHYADLDKADYSTIKRIYSERFASAGDFDFFITGNFDEALLKQYVEQYIASLQKCKTRENFTNHKIYPVEGVITNRFSRSMETPQAYIIQVWSGEQPYSLQEAAVVNALGSILTQRYLKSIREDAGFAYTVQADGSADYGVRDDYMVQIICPFTPAKCDSVLTLMKVGLEDIAANGVTEEELDKVLKFELKQYEDSQRENSYWSSLIQSKVIWGKDDYTGYEEAVKAVTSDSIKAFVNDVLLKQDNCATVIMLPEDFTE